MPSPSTPLPVHELQLPPPARSQPRALGGGSSHPAPHLRRVQRRPLPTPSAAAAPCVPLQRCGPHPLLLPPAQPAAAAAATRRRLRAVPRAAARLAAVAPPAG
jgi:hypothetical protein